MSGVSRWGAPAGIMNYCTGEMEYGGLIWYGEDPPTKDDIEALEDHYGFLPKIDIPTMFGLPSHRSRSEGKPCYRPPVVEL